MDFDNTIGLPAATLTRSTLLQDELR